MTLLQIDKRAVTPEEGQDLIDQTRELVIPFGIPTLHTIREESKFYRRIVSYGLNTENVDEDLDTTQRLQKVISSKLRVFLSSDSLKDINIRQRTLIEEAARGNFELFFLASELKKNQAYIIAEKEFPEFADRYSPNNYHEPYVNTIFRAGEESPFRYSHIEDVERMAEASKFHVIWHEIAHGTGAGEPQADMMAAIITRKSFAPSHVLRMTADERAIATILSFDDKVQSERYGWGMVDANDFIENQPEQRILRLTERQIKDLRFKRFDPLDKAVFDVGSSLLTIDQSRRKPVNLMETAQEADFLAETQFKNDEIAAYICDRFALACRRATLGHEFYDTVPEPEPPNGKYPSFIDEPEI